MHNRIENEIAIVGVGSTGFTRGTTGQSSTSLACEAAIKAIEDAGMKKDDIDGVVSSLQLAPGPNAREMIAALGFPRVTFHEDGGELMVSPIVTAMNAIHAGMCDTVLVYHPNYISPYQSKKAAKDPYRVSVRGVDVNVDSVRDAPAYAAWTARYFYENPSFKREHLGYVALNSRTNAGRNPLAVFREPLSMDEYLASRMVRDPFCLYDMDVPVDGADAFILTSATRARQLDRTPVLIKAAVSGAVADNYEDQMGSLAYHSHDVVVEELRARGYDSLAELDVAFIYDGFSIGPITWSEKLGWCEKGGAAAFFDEHWSAEENRILLNGTIPLNPHGGSLSEGATQGAGHIREAVLQLRGEAADRQVPSARTTLIVMGGFFFNAQAAMLVSDPG